MKIARFHSQGRTGYGVVVDGDCIVEPSAGFLSRHPDIRSVLAEGATQALGLDVAGRPDPSSRRCACCRRSRQRTR